MGRNKSGGQSRQWSSHFYIRRSAFRQTCVAIHLLASTNVFEKQVQQMHDDNILDSNHRLALHKRGFTCFSISLCRLYHYLKCVKVRNKASAAIIIGRNLFSGLECNGDISFSLVKNILKMNNDLNWLGWVLDMFFYMLG